MLVTNVRDLPQLERLILGHPTINGSPFTVDILIGADPYWDEVEDEIIKGPGPTAANSNLGYLLLGSLSMCNSSKKPQHFYPTCHGRTPTRGI